MGLGMQAAGTRGLMATLNAIQRHRIALDHRVIIEIPRAHMFSQYLCGTETSNSAHIIHKVNRRDQHRGMQHVRVLIN